MGTIGITDHQTNKHMGSIVSKIDDDKHILQLVEDREWLKIVAKEIEDIHPSSQEFRDLQWMYQNKDRIIGNKKIIELLR